MEKEIPKEIREFPKEEMNAFNKLMVKFFDKAVKNYELGEYFRYCAELDLKNAKILKKEGGKESLPQVVYLIQQSVEKFAKSYALIMGAVNKNKLRYTKKGEKGIGHISAKSFVYILRQKDLNDSIDSLKKMSPFLMSEKEHKSFSENINLKEEEENLNELILKKEGTLKKLSLKKVLDTYDKNRKNIKIYASSRHFERDLKGVFKSFWKPLVNFVFSKQRINSQRKIFVLQLNVLGLIFPLAFLTYFYESNTRYPNLLKKQLSPKDFMDRRKSIVKESERILERLENLNSDSKDLYSVIKSFYKLDSVKREKAYNLFIGEEKNN